MPNLERVDAQRFTKLSLTPKIKTQRVYYCVYILPHLHTRLAAFMYVLHVTSPCKKSQVKSNQTSVLPKPQLPVLTSNDCVENALRKNNLDICLETGK